MAPNTYLLKLHCEKDIRSSEPRPTKSAQWEGATVTFKPPIGFGGGTAENVSGGDTLIIWTHEDPEFGGGRGLTADATARHVQVDGGGAVTATLENVRLLQPHFRLRGWPGGTTGSAVIDYLLRNLLTRTYQLAAHELSEFLSVVHAHSAKVQQIELSSYLSEEELALNQNREAINEGFRRRYSIRETRPEQAEFRASLISRYGGRCALTKTGIEPILEAAHVVPFAESVALRNEPRNGLLLRADIHRLYDSALLSIRPENARVILSPRLKGTVYEALDGISVLPAPATPFLDAQYRFFLKMQKG